MNKQNQLRKPPMTTRFNRILTASRKGQAMIEFALIATITAIVLLVGIQYAMIGQEALALHQAAYQATRYAAINRNATQSDVQCFLLGAGSSCGSTAAASPTLAKNGGQYITVSMSPSNGRSFSNPVTITLNFDVCGSGSLFLAPNCGSFLGVAFPSTLSSTETALTE